jgi:hypothetical protein
VGDLKFTLESVAAEDIPTNGWPEHGAQGKYTPFIEEFMASGLEAVRINHSGEQTSREAERVTAAFRSQVHKMGLDKEIEVRKRRLSAYMVRRVPVELPVSDPAPEPESESDGSDPF